MYFEGVSASTLSVGTVRDPFFNDITNTEFVTIGGSDNPGYLNASISPSTTGQGMYRVTMQDENGTPYELLVGIFPPGYNGMYMFLVYVCDFKASKTQFPLI